MSKTSFATSTTATVVIGGISLVINDILEINNKDISIDSSMHLFFFNSKTKNESTNSSDNNSTRK